MVTSIASRRDHYWSEHEPLLVEIPSYIGAHRAPIIGESLCCDDAGSPLALVGISPRRKVDDFKYGKIYFPPWEHSLPRAGKKCLLPLGGGATSASFPYYVIGEGKVDLYWSLGGAI